MAINKSAELAGLCTPTFAWLVAGGVMGGEQRGSAVVAPPPLLSLLPLPSPFCSFSPPKHPLASHLPPPPALPSRTFLPCTTSSSPEPTALARGAPSSPSYSWGMPKLGSSPRLLVPRAGVQRSLFLPSPLPWWVWGGDFEVMLAEAAASPRSSLRWPPCCFFPFPCPSVPDQCCNLYPKWGPLGLEGGPQV